MTVMAHRSGINILLVDDSQGDARLVIEAMRQESPHDTLHHVIDGVQALEFLRQSGAFAGKPRPDIVLLDLNMPRMDGRAVLKAIKADSDLKAIPVVALTTSSAREDIQYCYEAGANAYISKPIDLDEFLNAMHQFRQFWLGVATLPRT